MDIRVRRHKEWLHIRVTRRLSACISLVWPQFEWPRCERTDCGDGKAIAAELGPLFISVVRWPKRRQFDRWPASVWIAIAKEMKQDT